MDGIIACKDVYGPNALKWLDARGVKIPSVIEEILMRTSQDFVTQFITLSPELDSVLGRVSWTLKIRAPYASLRLLEGETPKPGWILLAPIYFNWTVPSRWTSIVDAIQVWAEMLEWHGEPWKRISYEVRCDSDEIRVRGTSSLTLDDQLLIGAVSTVR